MTNEMTQNSKYKLNPLTPVIREFLLCTRSVLNMPHQPIGYLSEKFEFQPELAPLVVVCDTVKYLRNVSLEKDQYMNLFVQKHIQLQPQNSLSPHSDSLKLNGS